MTKLTFIEWLKIDNQNYYEHKLIAEQFAKHFSSVGKKFAGQIGSPSKDINHYLILYTKQPKINLHATSNNSGTRKTSK